MWKRVVVCGDYPKYGCLIKGLFGFSHLKLPAVMRSPVRHGGIHLPFKYSSDFIWFLGKNNLDSLMALQRQVQVFAIGKRRNTKKPTLTYSVPIKVLEMMLKMGF
jgi:hypothetical protein